MTVVNNLLLSSHTDAIIQQTIPGHGHEATNSITTASISIELSAITHALLRSLPCRSDISILSDRVGIILAMSYQCDYKSHSGKPIEAASTSTKTPSNLLQPEAHPTLLARQMLLCAGSLQHISPGEVILGLSQHQHVTMRALAESAIKSVNLDDALLGSLEGIENLILEMFYHVDCGDSRRAWTTARRAVAAAQMLGLHQAGRQRFLLMLAIEQDAAHQHGLLSHPRDSTKSQHEILVMREPYFGSICVSSEGVSPLSDADLDQSQRMVEGVSIGGIGSMMLRRRASAEVNDQRGSHSRDGTSIPAVPTSSTDADAVRIEHARTPNVRLQKPVMQNRSMTRYDVAPPFPAAGFDGWGF